MTTTSKKLKSTSKSRRAFLQTTAVAGAALAGTPLVAGTTIASKDLVAQATTESGSGKLKITVAGYDYDRIAGLVDGRVQVQGCETKFEKARIGDMNKHVFQGPKTRDATEIGLLPFILAVANDRFQDYSLIPVFALRVFRHKSIFIRTDRGITKPDDLRGKKVATPGYSSSSLTWIRGIMHTIAVRNDVIQANPWLPKALFDAYSQSKQLAYDAIRTTSMYFISLPWLAQDAEETRKLMGDNYWPYGIEPNRKTLNALLDYSHEQRLAKRKLSIEDIFHPSTLEFMEDNY